MAKDDSVVGDDPLPRSGLANGEGWCSGDVDDTAASISPASSSKEWTSASTEVTSNTNPNKALPPALLPPQTPLYSRPPMMEDIPTLLHTMITEQGVKSAAAKK